MAYPYLTYITFPSKHYKLSIVLWFIPTWTTVISFGLVLSFKTSGHIIRDPKETSKKHDLFQIFARNQTPISIPTNTKHIWVEHLPRGIVNAFLLWASNQIFSLTIFQRIVQFISITLDLQTTYIWITEVQNYGKFSIKYLGALVWNSLPTKLKEIKSGKMFKRQLKVHVQRTTIM